MKTAPKKRLHIYAQDIERITGRSASYSRNLIAVIRMVFNKKKHQGVTVNEYCEYMGVPRDDIEQFL